MSKSARRVAGEALSAVKRALYRGGRPSRAMKVVLKLDAWLYAKGLTVPQGGVLRVPGRRSGKATAVPIAIADVGAEEYLVSMLGPEANWVRNVEANGRRAVISRRKKDVEVLLEEVPVADRAPILQRYAAIAPGARPHLGVGARPTLEQCEAIASAHPVYRIKQGAARP